MDSSVSLPLRGEAAAKEAYSAPRLVDLGTIEQISLAGGGSVAEGAMMTAAMKHA